jgi:hypothetical protein
VNPEEDFEDIYTGKLRTLLAGSGTVLEYKRDRAAIDFGLHWPLREVQLKLAYGFSSKANTRLRYPQHAWLL